MASTNMPPLVLILIFLIITTTTITATSSTKSSLQQQQPIFPSSTISAAPSLLPDSPLPSPSPAGAPGNDITPLFPSPGGSELSPTESSLPTIPSSPSPPNPDDMSAPGPVMAFAPSGSLPFSSSSLNPPLVSGLPRLVTVVIGLFGFTFYCV